MVGGAIVIGLLLILFVILALFSVAGALRAFAAEDTKRAYLAALERLTRDPHNPALREDVLTLGRKHARAARAYRVPSLFDEVALANHLDAACARAGSVPAPQPTGGGPVEEQLAALDRFRARQLITEEEYKGRRGKLLDEV